jgi:hypothetical protein
MEQNAHYKTETSKKVAAMATPHAAVQGALTAASHGAATRC